MRRWSPIATLLTAALVAAACPPAATTRIDLVERFVDAEAFTETPLIDVGEPAGRRHLGDGWLPGNERWAGRPDESFVWATGNDATFRFFVFEPRDLVMAVRARPNPHPTAPPIGELGVEVNGRVLASLDVEAGWRSYRVVVPRQVVTPGENLARLIFGSGGDVSPGERRLAVERVDFERTLVTYPPRTEVGEPSLLIPYLSGFWFDLEAQEGDRLEVAELVRFGPHGEQEAGHIEVVLDTVDGRQERHTAAVGDRLSLALPEGTRRIGLMAVPAGDPNQRAERTQNEEAVGILLRRPAIRGGTAGSP